MPKFIVTIVETLIYESFVEADSLDEAKEIALGDEGNWKLSEYDGSVECGKDHQVYENKEWKGISG